MPVMHNFRTPGLVAALGGGLAATIGAIVGQQRVALGALGIAVAGVTVVLFLLGAQLHRLEDSTARLSQATRRRRRAVDDARREFSAHADRSAGWQQQTLDTLERLTKLTEDVRDRVPGKELSEINLRTKIIQGRVTTALTAAERAPSDMVNLARLQDLLVPGDAMPMPGLGGWAATAGTIEWLVATLIRADGPSNVVECGSGGSTVWMAAAMRHRGGGHVTALEHEGSFADRTREDLRTHGLEAYATVVHAPLTPLSGTGALWYDTAALAEIGEVDLLFVDGPPGATGPNARLPAFEQFAPLLRDGALVVLDDTNRADERAILDAWTGAPVAGRYLALHRDLDRASVLVVSVDR